MLAKNSTNPIPYDLGSINQKPKAFDSLTYSFKVGKNLAGYNDGLSNSVSSQI